MLTSRTTLAQYLSEERRRQPDSTGDVDGLILDVALACTAIAGLVRRGSLAGITGAAGNVNVQGEAQQKLDVVANDLFLAATERGGQVAAVVSEELDEPQRVRAGYPRGRYLLAFDPLDGSSNIDVNVTVGSIFSVLEAPRSEGDATAEDFLQAGSRQVAAGYALYGPATMLVLTLGRGVHGFTLDPDLGEFVLTHPDLRVPREAAEFAINVSNRRFWPPAVRRYVDECLAGRTGPRGKDFNMRWVASVVADAHRILTRGGVYLYPRDTKRPATNGRLRLLYEGSPIAFIMEQAGGAASTGRERVLDVEPGSIHARTGLIFGSADEVERLQRYHGEAAPDGAGDVDRLGPEVSTIPLYAMRGLFRANH